MWVCYAVEKNKITFLSVYIFKGALYKTRLLSFLNQLMTLLT